MSSGVLSGKKIFEIYAGCSFTLVVSDQLYSWGENKFEIKKKIFFIKKI
jgi:hypothetical protein